MSLKEYRKKRKFHRTPEPKGKESGSGTKTLRFFVQKHDATRVHFDFRIELDGVLKSWAVPRGPSMNPLDQRLAVRVEDHPIEYGSFEGVIPKGNYGAGTVMLWDSGTYVDRATGGGPDQLKILREGLAKGRLTLVLSGKRLKGEFALVRLRTSRSESNAWLLIKKRDSSARFSLVPTVKDSDRSIASKRTMSQIDHQSKGGKAVWISKRPLQRAIPKTSDKPPISHKDKVFWPKEGFTKGDLVQYYERISPYLLPHLKDRPESLRRQPDGLRNPGFFQKDMVGFVPRRIMTKKIFSQSTGKTVNYVLCQDQWTLLYLVNLGCIEFNPWLSRADHLDKPDFVVIDLDPDGNSYNEVVKVAKEVHKVLTLAGVKSWAKTSGASGMHICVPTKARYDFDTTRRFAELVCQIVHQRFPDLTSIERNPARRRKKIYLDFLQNRRGQTLAAPYCVRPLPGAPVSTPLKWSEVKTGLKPSSFTMFNIERRLKRVGDLWRPLLHSTTTSNNLEIGSKRLLKLLHTSPPSVPSKKRKV
jgi:bifunctional non-homologous end joining protein LigD